MPTEDSFNSLVANIDKHIKQIESDINRSNVTKETIDLFNKLNDERKELFTFDIEKEIINPLKKKYGTRILTLKKSLIFYYNSNVVLMIYTLKEMISKAQKIAYKKESDLLLKELNSFKIPAIYNKNINNFQDSLDIDFDKFIYLSDTFNKLKERIAIDENNFGEIEIGYINRYAIPKISDLIERYNCGERITTKQSINLDILLCKVKIRDIERKYKDNDEVSMQCLKARNTLDNLNLIVTKPKSKINNSEYYSLKNKIISFSEEINNYYINADKDNFYQDLPEFMIKYNKYVLEIENKYKNKNTQLYNNLMKYLDEINVVIKKIEQETKHDNIEINNQKKDNYYRVETIESANDFYKRYNKPIMLASAIGSMVLINTSVGSVLIPTIIFANVIAANKYAIIDKINQILEKAINAKRDNDGNVIKQNGIKLTIDDALNGLLKSVALLDKKRKTVISNLVTRVRNSTVVVKTIEHISKLRESYDIKKEESFDLKVIRLYYDFVLSGLSLEEFCKNRNISDEMFDSLVDYMQYKQNDRGLRR